MECNNIVVIQIDIDIIIIKMYNNKSSSSDHNKHTAQMNLNMNMSGPRISFSNDFVESSHMNFHTSRSSDVPVSSDFEFSALNCSMMSADELFSKGRLLPFKNNQKTAVTLRDELLAGADDDNDNNGGLNSMRPPKSGRWKGLLGLRKSHIGSKKADHGDSQSPKSSQ